MTTLAWYFAQDDDRLHYGGTQLSVGKIIEGEPEFFGPGLDASIDIMDALHYAAGSKLYRVRLSGKMAKSNDKLRAQKSECLWGLDATDTLHLFARRCALAVDSLWDMPQIVNEFLMTGDESLRLSAREHCALTIGGTLVHPIESRGNTVKEDAWDAARATAYDATGPVAWISARDAIVGANTTISRAFPMRKQEFSMYDIFRIGLISLVMEAAHGEVPNAW